MATIPSFFLPGGTQDVAYVKTRDHHRYADSRAFCEALWSRYFSLADPHFREDARNHFLERFWEMYLAVTLQERGLPITRCGNEGPEFFVSVSGRRLWIEAVAPGPGEGPDRVPEIDYDECVDVPVEKILLRFTSALAGKRNRYVDALNKGIIAPDDMYVLALNSQGVPYAPPAPHSRSMPYFVQAFLPFGPLAADVDVKTSEIARIFRAYRPVVRKMKGAEVSTRTFLDQEASFCSAVLHSAVDSASHTTTMGEDFSILHNPQAIKPVGPGVFSWCHQFFFRDNKLHSEEPNER